MGGKPPLVGRFGKGAGARAAGGGGAAGLAGAGAAGGAGMGGGGNDPWRGVRASRGGTMAGDPRGGVDRRARGSGRAASGGESKCMSSSSVAALVVGLSSSVKISESSNATSKLSPEGGP